MPSRTLPLLAVLALAGGAVPKPIVVDVRAGDYYFKTPATVPAGLVTFRLRSEGRELHHFWIVQLEQNHTLADLDAALKAGGPPPSWAVDVGGPQPPPPGGESSVTVPLTPGRYAVLCVIPSSDGTIHALKGMTAEFTVPASGAAPAAAAAGAPKADVDLRLQDYEFVFSRPLTAGHHVIHVETAPGQPHEVVFFKLAPGKTVEDGLAWVETMSGPPPMAPASGVTGLAAGRYAFLDETFTPGRYAVICFVPDARDGKPHAAHGMATAIDVR